MWIKDILHCVCSHVDSGFHHGTLSCGLLRKRRIGRQTAKAGTDALQTSEDIRRYMCRLPTLGLDMMQFADMIARECNIICKGFPQPLHKGQLLPLLTSRSPS